MGYSVQIRKEKTEQRKMTRRQMSQRVQMAGADRAAIERTIQQCTDAHLLWIQDPTANLPVFYEAVKRIREILSVDGEVDVAASAIVSADVLTFLYDALNDHCNPTLQQEAAWAITNIASTSYTKTVAEFHGMAHSLVHWLSNGQTPDLREYCAWALGNIAGEDNGYYREGLLKIDGIHSGLVQNLLHPETKSLLENVMWATAALATRSRLLPQQLTLAFVLPTIKVLQRSDTNDRIQADACRALWNLSEDCENDDGGQRLEHVMKFNVVELLDQLLEHHLTRPDKRDCAVLTQIAKCYGTIAYGTTDQCQQVVESLFMKCISKLMSIESKGVQKEVAWACSNIAAGTFEQAEALSSRHKALRMIAEAATSKHLDVRRESLYTICNLLNRDGEEEGALTEAVVQAGGMAALAANLRISDVSLLLSMLKTLTVMLEYNANTNGNLIEVLYEEQGIDKLEELQSHKSSQVYDYVVLIIDKYIGTEPGLDDEDYDFYPETKGDTYQFGVSKELFPNQSAFDFSLSSPDPALGGRF